VLSGFYMHSDLVVYLSQRIFFPFSYLWYFVALGRFPDPSVMYNEFFSFVLTIEQYYIIECFSSQLLATYTSTLLFTCHKSRFECECLC